MHNAFSFGVPVIEKSFSVSNVIDPTVETLMSPEVIHC